MSSTTTDPTPETAKLSHLAATHLLALPHAQAGRLLGASPAVGRRRFGKANVLAFSVLSSTPRVLVALRSSEPHSGFMRRNRPDANRWYSRDMAALPKADKLPTEQVAPYFVGANANKNTEG